MSAPEKTPEQETFDRYVTRVVEALRWAADEIETLPRKTPTVVHPVTRRTRQVDIAAAIVARVLSAVHEADLNMLVHFASEADLAPFPQTQEL